MDEIGGRMQARRGALVDALEGAGAIAAIGGQRAGLIAWFVAPGGAEAEVRALAVRVAARRQGIGRALLAFAEAALREAGVRRAWLVTTNDNLAALALYQRTGWRLSALRPGGVNEMRRTLKPTIPELGELGIPLRDELELELDFEPERRRRLGSRHGRAVGGTPGTSTYT